MKRIPFILCAVAVLGMAVSVGTLVLQVGDTGTLQCQGGALSITDQASNQLSAACNALPTNTPTLTQTSTPTATRTATVTPTASPTSSGPVVVTAQVASSSDDANEVNGSVDLTSTTVWLGTGGSSTTSYTGLRFVGLPIPQGATIASAHLEVYSTQSQWLSLGYVVGAEASGNSATFSTGSKPSQRTLVPAQVTHASNVQWQANTWYSLDEIGPVVQVVVNRADWQSGNALAVILHGNVGTWGRKFARSYDGAPAYASKLVITFSGTSVSTPASTATPTSTASATPTTQAPAFSLAVIGDSVQDEYRANDNRGAPYQATTFNWVELLANERALNFGAWGTRSEPRRSGYEYNWARSGATSAAALSAQLPGVMAQLQSGAVTHVVIQVGLNDFNQGNLALNIYNGNPSTATLNYIADNISSMARQANAVAPGRVLVAGTQDYVTHLLLPEIAAGFPSAAGRDRLTDAFAYLNARVQAQAVIDGVHYFDYNAALWSELSPRMSGNVISIGGQSITIARGNEYHSAWLDESPYAHAGTALSGLIANVYIDAINSAFSASISRMSDSEIITASGG